MMQPQVVGPRPEKYPPAPHVCPFTIGHLMMPVRGPLIAGQGGPRIEPIVNASGCVGAPVENPDGTMLHLGCPLYLVPSAPGQPAGCALRAIAMDAVARVMERRIVAAQAAEEAALAEQLRQRGNGAGGGEGRGDAGHS